MENQLFRQPMGEARQTLQRVLGEYEDFIEKRRAYSDAVLAYLESNRTEPRPGQQPVTMAVLCQDHVYEIGTHLAALREKLNSMRELPEWLAIRRSVQQESDAAFKLQSARRAEMPLEMTLGNARPSASVSLLVYRNLDHQFMDQVSRLWRRYYQSLADAVEQKPGGAAPLIAIRGGAGTAAPAKIETAPSDQGTKFPLIGIWTYLDRSQKFNGVAEPTNVLLELWQEKGVLMGRYRGSVPDFSGPLKLDLRLQGQITRTGTPQILEFQSKDPAATGQIVIEGPGENGLELMVERRVPAGSAIPRGREVLKRR